MTHVLTYILTCTLTSLSDIFSDILSCILFDTLFDILVGMFYLCLSGLVFGSDKPREPGSGGNLALIFATW